jgi:RNA polymerase sigma-70 factor (ECF subfamily)
MHGASAVQTAILPDGCFSRLPLSADDFSLCQGRARVSLSEVDRQLLDRCLAKSPRAWDDFVDRFLGLVVHVANHAAAQRGVQLTPEQRDDLVAEVFLVLVDKQLLALRHFRRHCSLATYLTVIARRVIVRRLVSPAFQATGQPLPEALPAAAEEARIENREAVEELLQQLNPQEAKVVRLFHLEGKSYNEISRSEGIPANSVGPVLSRARAKLRQA